MLESNNLIFRINIYITMTRIAWLQITVDLISLANDNYVNNNLKEILVYVYFDWIVNNQPKN